VRDEKNRDVVKRRRGERETEKCIETKEKRKKE
jgi:hypothetical protein